MVCCLSRHRLPTTQLHLSTPSPTPTAPITATPHCKWVKHGRQHDCTSCVLFPAAIFVVVNNRSVLSSHGFGLWPEKCFLNYFMASFSIIEHVVTFVTFVHIHIVCSSFLYCQCDTKLSVCINFI